MNGICGFLAISRHMVSLWNSYFYCRWPALSESEGNKTQLLTNNGGVNSFSWQVLQGCVFSEGIDENLFPVL